ncbi:hypothetical protein [Mycolicibacterium arenosum]|uniref:Uncharacterized protein n=1 Tax=Mycolicibacterium arenosum TaxID=2952157 RepID=A0ABT1M8G7_9MYCO|nr:hypothetical protein [Mycolicibacterium sp. CAU 1645]MCP9275165.1 hypothetical protein [Mycolicibacterium sp. CAU 1645]
MEAAHAELPDQQGEANKRLTRTQHLAPHTTLQGEVLPSEWEHTAAAHRDGLIGTNTSR